MISATSVTSSPASRKALAVPPVEMSSTPCAERPRAKSTRPVLSLTERSARAIFSMGQCLGSNPGKPPGITNCGVPQKRRCGLGLGGVRRGAWLGQARLAGRGGPLDGPHDLHLALLLEAALKHDLLAAAGPALVGEEDALLDRDRRACWR